MVYSADSFIERADECTRLADIAADELIRRELLQLRQSYLLTADRLRALYPLRHGFADR